MNRACSRTDRKSELPSGGPTILWSSRLFHCPKGAPNLHAFGHLGGTNTRELRSSGIKSSGELLHDARGGKRGKKGGGRPCFNEEQSMSKPFEHASLPQPTDRIAAVGVLRVLGYVRFPDVNSWRSSPQSPAGSLQADGFRASEGA